MPQKQVRFNGVIHNFPSDATDAEIRAVLEDDPATQDVLDRQKAKFPTSKEQDGAPGAMVQPQIDTTDPARTRGQVVLDQMAAVPRGIPKLITGIPGAVATLAGAVGNPGKQKELLDSTIQSFADHPLIQRLRGQFPAPEDPAWQSAAEGAGANLGGLVIPPALARIVPPVARGALNAVTTPEALERRAVTNTAKSLKPTTLEGQAITQRIAPEMSERQIRGTGRQIDAKLSKGLNDASAQLAAEEARMVSIPKKTRVSMTPLIAKVDEAIGKLKIKGTDLAVNTQAVTALEEIKKLFQSLPKNASFDQVLDLRRKLDAAVDDAGGFSQTSSAADRTTMKARRGGANIARAALNELDEGFKAANQNYAFHRNAMDVVERRQLGEYGKTGSGLPGRGSILDDVLAGWAGEALGGKAGAAALEGINLARQSRGWSSLKAGLQQQMADTLKKKP